MSSNHYDVVIVGAGISGLACAQRLLTGGDDGTDPKSPTPLKVVVLEARDRIGGRMYTIKLGNSLVDIGASWLHSMGMNALADIATDLGARLEDSEAEAEALANAPRTPYDPPADSQTQEPARLVWSQDDGRTISEQTLQAYEEIFFKLHKKLIKLGHKIQSDKSLSDISVYEAWKNLATSDPVAALLKQKLGKDANLLLNTTLAHYGGFNNCDEKKLSTAHLTEGGEEELDNDSLVLNGMSTIARGVGKDVPVLLNHTVTDIFHRKDGTKPFFVIKAANTATSTLVEYTATKVVVSVPLGVLKKGQIKFEPELPLPKRRAIRTLGFGVLNKVVLKFSTRFWPKSTRWLVHASNDLTDTTYFLSLFRHTGEPVLIGFTHGENAKFVEKNDDITVFDKFIAMLTTRFGESPKKLFAQGYCTRWKSEKHTYGSYTYIPLGSSGADYDAIAAPCLNETLLFCGEATNRRHLGTVDSAFNSGLREANRILGIEASKQPVLRANL